MKKLLIAAASVAVIAAAAPAFAAQPGSGGGNPTSIGTTPLAAAVSVQGPTTMVSDIGGTINAKCSFDIASPSNVKLNLYDKPANGLASYNVSLNLPIQCNVGKDYNIVVSAKSGVMYNTDDMRTGAARDSDVAYDATFKLTNSSIAHAWPSGPISLGKSGNIYSTGVVPVDAASGRAQVSLVADIKFKENANSKLGEGGIAWRAGLYKETFTSVITPNLDGSTFTQL